MTAGGTGILARSERDALRAMRNNQGSRTGATGPRVTVR